jgi:hypothetical protein
MRNFILSLSMVLIASTPALASKHHSRSHGRSHAKAGKHHRGAHHARSHKSSRAKHAANEDRQLMTPSFING